MTLTLTGYFSLRYFSLFYDQRISGEKSSSLGLYLVGLHTAIHTKRCNVYYVKYCISIMSLLPVVSYVAHSTLCNKHRSENTGYYQISYCFCCHTFIIGQIGTLKNSPIY